MTDNSTIHSLAGYCNENILWKLLVDLSSKKPDETSMGWKVLLPDLVIVDGEDFRIDEIESLNPDYAFYPPEGIGDYGESGFVWSLGALTCYASSGHYVFGGRGGVYQYNHPEVELPTLRKEHFALTPIVKRCLCYSPSERISLKELRDLAVKGLESNNQMSRLKRSIESSEMIDSPECLDDVWPEKMV